jgi:RimJ/RimL family protein N-acetyltransferase
VTAGRVPVDPADIRLVPGKGSELHGGGPGGRYWHIYVCEIRAGLVYINRKHDDAFGDIASIQIQLDREQQGRKVGRVAYRLPCEASGYDRIYAEMRKSNVASRRAAEEAGFVIVPHQQGIQLTMVWNRPAQDLQL